MIYLMMFIVFVPIVLWVVFLAGMNMKRNQDKMGPYARAIAYPVIIFGYALDTLFNWVFGSVLFLEIPREFLFTDRVSRHNDFGGWRGDMARWFCERLLNPFDPDGKHCK